MLNLFFNHDPVSTRHSGIAHVASMEGVDTPGSGIWPGRAEVEGGQQILFDKIYNFASGCYTNGQANNASIFCDPGTIFKLFIPNISVWYQTSAWYAQVAWTRHSVWHVKTLILVNLWFLALKRFPKYKTSLRCPGIEPGSTAWKAAMLTTIPTSLG